MRNRIHKLLNLVIEWFRTFIQQKLKYKTEHLPYYLVIIIAIIIFTIGLKVFIELIDELGENELETFDKTITTSVQSFRSDGLTAFFRFVTDLGDRYTYITLIVALANFFWFRYKNWKFTVQMVAVLILATLSNIGLKQVINRARPSLDHLVEVNTLSFPSGHSMSAMAFYGFLVYLCLNSRIQLWLKTSLSTILLLLILSIGISRIYLGVHYPSDVAAGFMGGLIWVALCAITLNILEIWRSHRAEKLDQSRA